MEAGKDLALFIFSCPETTPVRTKMTMSSSKVSASIQFFFCCSALYHHAGGGLYR